MTAPSIKLSTNGDNLILEPPIDLSDTTTAGLTTNNAATEFLGVNPTSGNGVVITNASTSLNSASTAGLTTNNAATTFVGVNPSGSNLVLTNGSTILDNASTSGLTTDNAATEVLGVGPSGSVVIANGSSLLGGFASGVFTPVWTTLSGFSANPTVLILWWHQIGNYVLCSALFNAPNPAAGTAGNSANITLPVARATNFTDFNQLGGTVAGYSAGTTFVYTGLILAVPSTNNMALIDLIASSVGAMYLTCSFGYSLV
jgi:hypothetical protein